MAKKQNATPPTWLGRKRLDLLWSVLSGFKANLYKIRNTLYGLSCWLGNPAVKRRIKKLRELGFCEHEPTVSQMLVAGRDQIFISATGETKVFYESQGIPWIFHNVRRVLQDPSTMMDPIGVLSHRDSIINHIFQTFHRHPVYDWGLLMAHDTGIEAFDKQLGQLLKGEHIHQRGLTSLIEDGSYHERLVHQWAEFKNDPLIKAAPIPQGLVDNEHMMMAMDQFKDIKGFMAYASRLEVGMFQALGAVFSVITGRGPKTINVQACDPDIVERHRDAAQSD